MLTLDQYLDAALLKQRFQSDRQLSASLGLTEIAVSTYRTRRAWPRPAIIIAIAEMGGLDPRRALIDLNTWKAQSERERSLYQQLRQAIPSLIIGAFLTAALLAPATARSANGSASAAPDLYIMRYRGRARKVSIAYLFGRLAGRIVAALLTFSRSSRGRVAP